MHALFLKNKEQPLLPALRKLRWDQSQFSDLTAVSSFLAPTLNTIRIAFGTEDGETEHSLDHFLRALECHAPTLEYLTISVPEHRSQLTLAPIADLQKLRSVNLCSCTESIFLLPLSQVTTLTHLEVNITGMDMDIPQLVFTALRSLVLEADENADDISLLYAITSHITAPLLEALRISSIPCEDPDDLIPFLSRMCTQFGASLQSLAIMATAYAWPRVVSFGLLFGPIRRLHALEIVHLTFEWAELDDHHVPGLFDLTDSDICEFASAWPKLREFTIHGEMQGSLSPRAFIDLARLCPELLSLNLPKLDISQILTSSPPSPRIDHNLTSLFVKSLSGGAFANYGEERKALAHFIYAVFPHISGDTTFSWENGLSEIMEEYAAIAGIPYVNRTRPITFCSLQLLTCYIHTPSS